MMKFYRGRRGRINGIKRTFTHVDPKTNRYYSETLLPSEHSSGWYPGEKIKWID